jgi:hypothetical protein
MKQRLFYFVIVVIGILGAAVLNARPQQQQPTTRTTSTPTTSPATNVRTEKQGVAARGEGSKFVGKWVGYDTWSRDQDEFDETWEGSVARENGKYRVLLKAKDDSNTRITFLGVYANGKIVAEGKRENFYKSEIPTLKALPDGSLTYTDGATSLRFKKAHVDTPPASKSTPKSSSKASNPSAERARLTAEVAKIGASVSADVAAAAAPNRAQVERGLADRWVGSFGRVSKAYLNITVYQGVNALLAKEGWQEMLRGELRADNKLLLTGTVATRGGKVVKYSLDTIQLELSADRGSLTGVYRDASGNIGFVAMKRNNEPDRD